MISDDDDLVAALTSAFEDVGFHVSYFPCEDVEIDNASSGSGVPDRPASPRQHRKDRTMVRPKSWLFRRVFLRYLPGRRNRRIVQTILRVFGRKRRRHYY